MSLNGLDYEIEPVSFAPAFPNLTAENRQCFDPKKKQEKKKALHNRWRTGQKEAE